MLNEHRRNKRQASVILVILRLAALSLSAMGITFYATEKWFSDKALPGVRSEATVSTSATATPASMQSPPIEQPGEADLLNPSAPVTKTEYRKDGVPFMIIAGGVAGTRRSPVRVTVQDIVRESGAKAGLNGTFFANASLTGTDNLLIGPSLCGDESSPTFSPFDKRKELAGRPLVLMAPNQTRILPYDPDELDTEAGLRSKLPGLTDVFLGGVWLVHHGVPVAKDDIDKFQIHDAEDPRRRAFFVLMDDGRPGLGATTYVTESSRLARALSEAGVREAVLLDSGFSTSLVEDGKILVTGHTSPGIPSRPVPHAIVLFDTHPAPASQLARTSHAPRLGA
jgi:hypothetical protein